MQDAHHRHRLRVLATLGAAGAHLYLAVIGSQDLLNYTVPTRYPFLIEVASSETWAWIHGACAALLLACLVHPTRRPHLRMPPMGTIATGIAFAMMLTWAFFNMMWGLTTIRPVSLAGPGLALIVAAFEQLLAHSWTRGTHDKGW